MKKELSVVMPAYNEEENIGRTLEETAAYLRSHGYDFEILVVDDGSRDKTYEIVSGLSKKHPEIMPLRHEKNAGKGHAVKTGIRMARKTYCLFMDADNSTSIREWDKFEEQFKRGERVVVASRRLPESRITHPQPVTRRALGSLYRLLCRALFGLKTTDFNCGFKAYETALAKRIYEKVQLLDWAFDTEVFYLLKKEGARATEVPVRWEHRAKHSNLAPFRAGFQTMGSLWRLKQLYR